jgi:hypothetical protein
MTTGQREWNPLWTDPEDDDNKEYVAAIRRMIIAAINWIENHPQATPEWQELNVIDFLRQQGKVIPPGVSPNEINIMAFWSDYYKTKNAAARRWFHVMVQACSQGDPRKEPTSYMMGKAIACGMMLKSNGWDEFNQFMLQPLPGQPRN